MRDGFYIGVVGVRHIGCYVIYADNRDWPLITSPSTSFMLIPDTESAHLTRYGLHLAIRTGETDMATSEFQHYDGCRHRDPDNCQACALTDTKQERPNYSAWPLAYMANHRPIPAKWRKAFHDEMLSSNTSYVANIHSHIIKYGVTFTDGAGL